MSVREISKITGADVKSWTEPGAPGCAARSTRTFNIEVRLILCQVRLTDLKIPSGWTPFAQSINEQLAACHMRQAMQSCKQCQAMMLGSRRDAHGCCFSPQGTQAEISHALFVFSEAVDRYKALCEGTYCGEFSASSN